MTNTTQIGQINHAAETDRLSAYKGYKVALTSTGKKDDFLLTGPHRKFHTYGLSDEGQCVRKRGLGCSNRKAQDFTLHSCGFYAYNNVDLLNEHVNLVGVTSELVLLEVALSQKVVVAENGYRASHQRVTQMLFGPCWNCMKPANRIIKHRKHRWVSGCFDCLESTGSLQYSFSTEEISAKYSPAGFDPIKVGFYTLRSGNLAELFGVSKGLTS